MAPSVIYIDEVEKVFVSDKKKAREFGGQVSSCSSSLDLGVWHAWRWHCTFPCLG